MDPSTNKIPLGIEVLVNKASVDPDFRQLLIERRAEAAREIGLELEPAEAAMLASIPREQLEIIIDHTEVPRGTRRIFFGSSRRGHDYGAGSNYYPQIYGSADPG